MYAVRKLKYFFVFQFCDKADVYGQIMLFGIVVQILICVC